MGGFEAIKKVGQGSFMVITGDLDPPQATRELIDMVFGKKYLWYPIVGNHDFEKAADIQYLRALNSGDKSLSHLVRKGPVGSEETSYSFDWNDAHFIVLNLYYDGKSDIGGTGNIAPELFDWLQKDLDHNTKKCIFVFGHEPLLTIPDMDNGSIRHQGNSLDQYPETVFKFHQMLVKYKVTAYICGHTHRASFANINGLWQFDPGHIRGYEADYTPDRLYARISEEMKKKKDTGITLSKTLVDFYKSDIKEVNKIIFSLGFGSGKSYDEVSENEAITGLNYFFIDYEKSIETRNQHKKKFQENCGWGKSSFLRITVNKTSTHVEIYRDDDFSGNYILKHSQLLNQ
ncbi:MAG: metallophosphoesterase [bacterium]